MVYKEKRRIEQLFATLKTAGLNIEATQLESIAAIQRLTVLALSVFVRILQLIQGRDNFERACNCCVFGRATAMLGERSH